MEGTWRFQSSFSQPATDAGSLMIAHSPEKGATILTGWLALLAIQTDGDIVTVCPTESKFLPLGRR